MGRATCSCDRKKSFGESTVWSYLSFGVVCRATWVFDDLLQLASLPSGAAVRPVVCKLAHPGGENKSATCLDALIVNAGGEGGASPTCGTDLSCALISLDTLFDCAAVLMQASRIRVGAHAYDRSYAEVETIEFEGLSFQLRWSNSNDEDGDGGSTAAGSVLRWVLTPLNTTAPAILSDFGAQ